MSLFSKSYEQRKVADLLEEDDGLLAVIEFGPSPDASSDPRHVPVALRPLGGDREIEVWRVRGRVEAGQSDRVRFSRGFHLTMGHIVLDVDASGGIREASRLAYAQVSEFLANSAHHWPLKIWNYIPGINTGEADAECYRQFCVGRAEALAAGAVDQLPMPAATAIGTAPEQSFLQVYFLAGARPGLNVENPRQVNAWRYPRAYGPRSPLFSRGTIAELGEQKKFLISGTASVVGHETHHADDVRRQVLESWRNVTSLIAEGRRLLGGASGAVPELSILKVYVREPEDLPTIDATLREALPAGVPRIYLQGDICRRDLLTEMDGIVEFA